MLAIAGAALVDHARSAHRQSKGSGPGLVPLFTRPRNWGEGGVRGLPPTPVKFLLAHHPGPAVPWASYLGCPVLCWAALYCCCGGGGKRIATKVCRLILPSVWICSPFGEGILHAWMGWLAVHQWGSPLMMPA